MTLAELPGLAFGFSLLLARFGALVMVAPGIGEGQVPAMVRAGLAACLAALLLPALGPGMPPVPPDGGQYAALLGAELLTGLWFGWLARLVALALPAAAQFITLMSGLANVIAPDPMLGQTSVLSRTFGLVPPLLLLASGLYMVPIQALAASYRLIPAGAVLPQGDAVAVVVTAVAASFALAVRLAGPFIVAGTVWQMALGITARLVPSLQVYQLALPGQVLGGMLLLALTLPLMLAAWLEAARGSLLPMTGG